MSLLRDDGESMEDRGASPAPSYRSRFGSGSMGNRRLCCISKGSGLKTEVVRLGI